MEKMARLTRTLATILLLGMLSGCTSAISFQNAKFSERDTRLSIRGLLNKPSGDGPFPALVLLHTCGGLQPHVTRDWPDYLTGIGFVTFAVDSFGSRGIRSCPTPLSRDRRELSRDAYGALEYLGGLSFIDKNRIGVVGFSLGGNTIDYFVGQDFKTADGLNFAAAVNVYGDCRNLPGYARTIPTAVIIGDLENEPRLAPCKSLAAEARPSIKVHVLPGTYHGFDHQQITVVRPDSAGNPMLYSWEATKRAREITKEFLAEHLGK
jgi:dienelactone hydrolase